MPQTQLTIVNKLGLHARAAARFVEVAQTFSAGIELSLAPVGDSETDQSVRRVDGKSIMSVMLLAAGQGTQLVLRAEGADADAALAALDALVADKFGEDL